MQEKDAKKTQIAVCERIKFLRGCLNMTQTDFAEAVGTSRAALSFIEIGRTAPNLDMLVCISDRWAVSHNATLDWLLTGAGDGPTPTGTYAKERIAARSIVSETKATYGDVADDQVARVLRDALTNYLNKPPQ